jgi:hypothetical protein
MSDTDEETPGLGGLLDGMSAAMKEFHEEHGDMQLSHEFEYPLEVSKIMARGGASLGMHEVGSLVRIRPITDNEEKKTFFGIYLGDLHRETILARGTKSNTLFVSSRTNPAIWVFARNQIVWGDSSWWGPIESEEQFDECITDESIDSIWYVKLLREQLKQQAKDQTS